MADYHQYVFRDGKLVAEFEEMYQRSGDIPWHQDEQDSWIDVRLTAEFLKDIGPFDEIHDFGCGLGYYLDILKSRIGSVGCRAYGYDVSDTACIKAVSLFPDAEFAVFDLMADPLLASQPASQRLFLIRGTLWYVFPEFANVVANLRSKMRRGELLLVVQNFQPLESSFVGKNVMPDPQSLMQWFSTEFDSIRTLWYEDRMKSANDNWFIGLFFAR